MSQSSSSEPFEKPLAIHGGSPTFPDGPPDWPLADPQIADALRAAFESGDWGRYHGAATKQVEQCVAALVGQPHVRLCSSGTAGIELALRACGVTGGDEVILGGYDFPGNFRCIEACQATPVLIDVELNSGCIDPGNLDRAYSPATKAVIVSHLHGGLAAMQQIVEWARKKNVRVIEDACQAPGAVVDGQVAGSWGDVCVLSFGGSKLLTAGRGGAVATGDTESFQRMKIFADRGNDMSPLSELQAAVLPCQFRELAQLNERRRKSAATLRHALRDHPLICVVDTGRHPDQRPTYYKIGWRLNPDRFASSDRAAWISAVQAEGLACDAGFRGFVRRGPRRCRRVGELTNSRLASDLGVVLHHPILLQDEETIRRAANVLIRVTNALV